MKPNKKSTYTDTYWLVCIILILVLSVFIFKNKSAIKRFIFPTHLTLLADYKRPEIVKHEIHGIDISHHQGDIRWGKLKHPDTSKNIDFLFIRATNGVVLDRKFHKNWENAEVHNFTKGAYHFYISDMNSTKQANHFIQNVKLKKGDLPPVLDIETLPKNQSKKNWLIGIRNWIAIVEKNYGVLPIIYTGDRFYRDQLKPDNYFKNYPCLWIANYNMVSQPESDWDFWQYTEKVVVEGITEYVDFNVFNGDAMSFQKLTIQ